MGFLQEKLKAHGLDIEAFRAKADERDALPDVHLLERVEDQALWALLFSKDKVGVSYLSAAEISQVLAEVFEISTTEKAVRMALTRAKGRAHVRKDAGINKFCIMRLGREALYAASRDRVIVIDPASPHTAIQKIADLLGTFSGLVKICDPYIDRKTLEILSMIPGSCQIRLISNPPRDGIGFARHYKAFAAQRPGAQVRTIPAGQIHDRYVLVGDGMWLVGHSLNAIGTKQTFVVKLNGDVKRQIERWFDATWAVAQALT